MSYLAGHLVLAVDAGAPNNGRGSGTMGEVKKVRRAGGTYPYVSAQAFRRWVRDSMADAGAVPSPVERAGKGTAQKATTAADPIRYLDDDLFGFMKATARKEGESTMRDSPFMVGTLMAVEPVRVTPDFGVMSRGGGDPVIYEHEFYTADLAAPFLLDLPRIGTFTLRGAAGGRPNYLTEQGAREMAEAARLGAETLPFRGQTAVRLPLPERRERAARLVEALAAIAGGAKKALHYGDRVPALIAILPMKGGINPLGRFVTGTEGGHGLRVRGDVLREELSGWDGEWESPVRIGWRPGFYDQQRKEFEDAVGPLLDEGRLTIDHPRSMLLTLATDMRAGEVDTWFEDPSRDPAVR